MKREKKKRRVSNENAYYLINILTCSNVVLKKLTITKKIKETIYTHPSDRLTLGSKQEQRKKIIRTSKELTTPGTLSQSPVTPPGPQSIPVDSSRQNVLYKYREIITNNVKNINIYKDRCCFER